MYQDFAVTPNTTYNASFLFSGVSDYNGTASSTYGMFVGAASLDGSRVTYSDTYTVNMGTAAYLSVPTATLKSFSFTTGSETQERLAFFSTAVSSVVTSESYFGPVIDNVQVANASAPEPATLTMCIAGVLGMSAYAWRKRKSPESIAVATCACRRQGFAGLACGMRQNESILGNGYYDENMLSASYGCGDRLDGVVRSRQSG